MKFIVRLAIALLLVLSVASPVLARMAVIETTAALQNSSQQSVNAAFQEAAQTAVRGAAAMGFAWIQLLQASMRGDMVAVRILATDTEPDAEPDDEDAPEPDSVSERF